MVSPISPANSSVTWRFIWQSLAKLSYCQGASPSAPNLLYLGNQRCMVLVNATSGAVTVLIVDDDVTLRWLLCKQLASMKANV